MGCPLSIIFLATLITWWVLRMNRVLRAQEKRIEELQREIHSDEVDRARESSGWMKDDTIRSLETS
jgi:hypothetical protein